VKVTLRNPRREVEVDGPTTVGALLARLEVSPESVLVIVGDELVTHDARLAHDAEVEIRPVISGGSDSGIVTSPAAPRTAGSSRR
jgi:sulfur carrier protein